MTTKEYLAQAPKLRKDIANKMEQARLLGELQSGAALLQNTGRRGKGGVDPQSLDLLALDTARELDRLYGLGQEIMGLVECVENPNHRTLLTLRYICGLRWSEVAQRMHYSLRHVTRMHRQALEELSMKCERGM